MTRSTRALRPTLGGTLTMLALGTAGCVADLGGAGDDPALGQLGQEARSLQGPELTYSPVSTPISYSGGTSPSGAAMNVSVSGTVITGITATGNLAPSQLVGAWLKLTGTSGVMLKVLGVQNHYNFMTGTVDPSKWEYLISYQSGTSLVPLCSDGGVAQYAVPLEGTFTNDGLFRIVNDGFTFACTTTSTGTRRSTAVKALDWGYRWWSSYSGTTLGAPTTTRTIAGVDLFNAATRFGRADYCANNSPHTILNTPVEYYDILKVNLDTTVAGDGFVWEAAWRPGASGTQSAAVCLTRERWRSIPVGNSWGCPTLLPDPRLDGVLRDCASLGQTGVEAAGGLILNKSKLTEAGLWRWAASSVGNRDNYTSSGNWDDGLLGRNPPDTLHGTAAARWEGALYTQAGYDALSTVLPAGSLLALKTYKTTSPTTTNPLDYLTTTQAAPSGYSLVGTEGYVYAPTATAPAAPSYSVGTPTALIQWKLLYAPSLTKGAALSATDYKLTTESTWSKNSCKSSAGVCGSACAAGLVHCAAGGTADAYTYVGLVGYTLR